MVAAGVDIAVAALFVLVVWSFLVQIIGRSITSNHWLLDTALLSSPGPVPAASLDRTAIASLAGPGSPGALAGLLAFNRRDLAAG
jgi:hypothetical protein